MCLTSYFTNTNKLFMWFWGLSTSYIDHLHLGSILKEDLLTFSATDVGSVKQEYIHVLFLNWILGEL